MAMSWDLMRGAVRSQLGLPQRRPEIAAGLWLSAVGVAFAINLTGMLLGAVVIAPLLGRPADVGLLSLHAVLSLVLAGTMQFLLTGLPGTPPKTLAGNIKGGIVGMLWGLAIWVGMSVSFVAPESWARMDTRQTMLMILLGGLTVISWFTTRNMLMERAVPTHEAAPVKAAGDLRAMSLGVSGWRVCLSKESRWFLPVVMMVLLAATFMISIRRVSGSPGGLPERDLISFQFHSMGMLCGMILFPLLGVSAGTLRACRGVPVRLGNWAALMTLRPFAGGLVVHGLYTLVSWAMGRSSGVEGGLLLAFLPLCSGLSLVQAVMLRHPRMPVMFPLLMLVSLLGGVFSEWLLYSHPNAVAMLGVAGAVLALSCWLHLRWLGNSSQVYRLNQGFLRMMGGAQR